MTGGSKLIAVGTEADDVTGAHDETFAAEDAAPTEQSDFEPIVNEAGYEDWLDKSDPAPAPRSWLAPSIAALLIAAWTGFFSWVHHRAMLAGVPPAQWSDWIVSWTVPVLLVVAICLLAMRNSTREARRFGDTAAMLSDASARLESRLTTVNRELSLAREFWPPKRASWKR